MHSRRFPGMNREAALSPVIGEMLMIVLAILLVSLFSVSLAGLLPAGRDYTIDISHNESYDGTTIYLWHKGGDWVDKAGLEVLIISSDGKTTTSIPATDQNFTLYSGAAYLNQNSRTFDLGDYIRITRQQFSKGDIIRLVSPRNVIFSGTADPEQPPT